jgi:hypothetical protein
LRLSKLKKLSKTLLSFSYHDIPFGKVTLQRIPVKKNHIEVLDIGMFK